MNEARWLVLAMITACSDYEFTSAKDLGAPSTPHGDDTASDDTPDTGSEDECYEPDSAYDMHPAAGLVVTQAQELSVTFEGSDAGYTNELHLSSPSELHLATGHLTTEGDSTVLGTFSPGTELVFSILVTDTGYTFYSGPSSRNADDFVHAAITYDGDCVWLVGFEDEYGGGDQDFDDIELTISGPLQMQLVE
ncbi:MAG: DUF4114 domain-containing protein [Myxococcota bacterium]|nr:DUF4114 domain-containing protein [Myxococcota bacterium]